MKRFLGNDRIWILAIFFAAVLAFIPAIFNAFCYDDVRQVQELAVPHGLSAWLGAAGAPWWFDNIHHHLWRPLTRLSILIQKAATGESAWPFYAANVLLHAAVSVLLFLLGKRLGLSSLAAGIGALIFAVHPMHSEAIHQVVGRAEMFVAFWSLAGLLLLLKYGLRDWRALALQPLIFALALASKESGLTYPALALLALCAVPKKETEPRGRPWDQKEFWLLIALFGVVFGLFIVAKLRLMGGFFEDRNWIPIFENPLGPMSFLGRLPAVMGIFGYVVTRLVWPFGLSPDYAAISFPFERHWGWGWSWAGLALFAILAVWMLRDFLRGRRGWAMAAAFLATYAIISNAIIIGTVMAQRLWYVPSLPLCLGAGWLLAQLIPGPALDWRRLLAPAIFIFALALGSWAYAPDWRSNDQFTRAILARFPNNRRGLIYVIHEQTKAGDYPSGYLGASQAVKLFPWDAEAWALRGINAMYMADTQAEAQKDFDRALSLDPSMTLVHLRYAFLMRAQGNRPEAIRHLEEYLKHPEPEFKEKAAQELEILKKENAKNGSRP